MGSWFNHVYLDRLFDAMLYATDDRYQKAVTTQIRDVPLSDADPRHLEDPAINQFLALVGLDPGEKHIRFGELKVCLRKWLLDHPKGPATYDPDALNQFFASRSSKDGWRHLDAVLNHMCGSTLSEIVDNTKVLHDPSDEGLHGDTCFTLDLELWSFELTNFAGYRSRLAMASSLDRLLPLMLTSVKDQGDRFVNLRGHDKNPENYTQEKKLERAKPATVHINRNGRPVFKVEVVEPVVEGNDFTVDWAKAEIKMNDKDILKSMLNVAPGSAASKLKGRFLEDGLGL